jgi:hypothetical protein
MASCGLLLCASKLVLKRWQWSGYSTLGDDHHGPLGLPHQLLWPRRMFAGDTDIVHRAAVSRSEQASRWVLLCLLNVATEHHHLSCSSVRRHGATYPFES